MYLTNNSRSSASVTHLGKNIVTIRSYPYKKVSIFPRERIETHVTKPQYEGSDNSHTHHSHRETYIQYNNHTERSHGERDIQVYKDIE